MKYIKKGFTLVELLAVIVVLGIILVIAVPNILNLINKAKIDAYERQKDLIITVARNYIINSGNQIAWTDDVSEIYLKDLQDANLIDNPLKDPRGGNFDNRKPEGTKIILTKIDDNTIDYDIYVPGPVTDTIPPVITLLGPTVVNITQGDTYTDQGATASDNEDGDITSKIVTNNTVDPLTAGTYTITYNVSDNAGNTATQITRTVNVNAPLADNSGASLPELSSNMIPVKWNGTKWVKADVNNYQGTNEWYNYNNKIWANAVTVTAATRATYQSAAVGTEILMNDILTFFVWIPRYKYLIPAGEGPREINIVFESKATAKSNGDAVNTYLTHPTFTFNGAELNGIWVGKFETTGTIATPTIKPNLMALNFQKLSAFFDATKAMQNVGNAYGFPTTGMDIHIIKNMDWGAVAFLSHSKYGKNAEIWINPADNYTTGCAGDSVSSASTTGCLRTYETTNGVKASTTGNIYGIYGMSGGILEYAMGNYNNTIGSSAFASMPSSQYYNLYTISTGVKGDATTATADGTENWYSDLASFINAGNPWFVRGGSYMNTTGAGIFYFGNFTGNDNAMLGFRITITP